MKSSSPPPQTGIDIVLKPQQDQQQYLVVVPQDTSLPVSMSEHWRWQDSDTLRDETFWNSQTRMQTRLTSFAVRCLLTHQQWQAIAQPVLTTFKAQLKGKRAVRWRKSATLLSRDLGRELLVLMWGIELADLSLIPTALRNWRGLLPEERGWLCAKVYETSDATMWRGRGRAWRKAFQYLLTENPTSEEAPSYSPEFFGGAKAVVAPNETLATCEQIL